MAEALQKKMQQEVEKFKGIQKGIWLVSTLSDIATNVLIVFRL